MTSGLDLSESQAILEKLESLEDEALAVELLREFNEATKKLGQLLLNLDPDLDSHTWKLKCDKAKKSVDEIVNKIQDL